MIRREKVSLDNMLILAYRMSVSLTGGKLFLGEGEFKFGKEEFWDGDNIK